jgi:hypothetical protein
MSIGNTKDYGNKGNNFPYQLKSLQGLQCACDQLQAINGNTDQVEGLLTLISNLLQNGQDYESTIVEDANGDLWLEVRIWNGTSFDPPVYYAAGTSTPGTPVAPLTYINSSTYLAQIVSNTTDISLEATQQDVLSEVQNISSNTSGINLEVTQQDILSAVNNINLNTGDVATETTLVTVSDNVVSINAKLTAAVRVPNILRVSGVTGTITDDLFSVSFSNTGNANASVNSVDLKPGETINFDAGVLNNYYAASAFTYDTTTSGAELLIIYTTA